MAEAELAGRLRDIVEEAGGETVRPACLDDASPLDAIVDVPSWSGASDAPPLGPTESMGSMGPPVYGGTRGAAPQRSWVPWGIGLLVVILVAVVIWLIVALSPKRKRRRGDRRRRAADDGSDDSDGTASDSDSDAERPAVPSRRPPRGPLRRPTARRAVGAVGAVGASGETRETLEARDDTGRDDDCDDPLFQPLTQ